MTKNNRYTKTSPETQEDAMKVAKATQRSGQTKDQTKLIAQGIEKGIDHYKKQQKVKSRELNKKIYKVSKQLDASSKKEIFEIQQPSAYKKTILPWTLLIVSWLAFIGYIFIVQTQIAF